MYEIRIEKNGLEVSFSDTLKGELKIKNKDVPLAQIYDLIGLLCKVKEMIKR